MAGAFTKGLLISAFLAAGVTQVEAHTGQFKSLKSLSSEVIEMNIALNMACQHPMRVFWDQHNIYGSRNGDLAYIAPLKYLEQMSTPIFYFPEDAKLVFCPA